MSFNTKTILDINADAANSFGVYRNTVEENLMDYVSSVNIACGLHAGDPSIIMETLQKASQKNLSVGALVGYPDIQGFGCREMTLSDEELKALIVYQIGALSSLAKLNNIKIEHVRCHGALYKQAAADSRISTAVAEAIKAYDPWLIYVGAAGENLKNAGETSKIKTIGEIHLNREYNYDGTINFEAAPINNKGEIFYRLELLLRNGCVKNNQGGKTKVEFGTIHLDSNFDGAIEVAQKARELIKEPMPARAVLLKNSGWL